MRVDVLQPTQREAYDQFLLEHPWSLLYYGSRYKDFLKALLGCGEEYLVALEGDAIRGVLPLMYMENSAGRVYNSLPYYGSNGGIVADEPAAKALLLNAYTAIAHSGRTKSSTVIGNPLAQDEAISVDYNYIDHRIGQFTSLVFQGDIMEGLMARIDASARRNVKKAFREGVTVEVDHTQMGRLREMHQENMRSIGGLAKTDEFFTLVPEHFQPRQDYDVYLAKWEGQIIAGLLVFYFNRTAEYFTPAVVGDNRTVQAMAPILATAMTDAARRGFQWWNWGGTWLTQEGVYRFKKKWGAIEQNYTYRTQLNDASILGWPQEKILKTFPNFYVVPFSALTKEGQ